MRKLSLSSDCQIWCQGRRLPSFVVLRLLFLHTLNTGCFGKCRRRYLKVTSQLRDLRLCPVLSCQVLSSYDYRCSVPVLASYFLQCLRGNLLSSSILTLGFQPSLLCQLLLFVGLGLNLLFPPCAMVVMELSPSFTSWSYMNGMVTGLFISMGFLIVP